MVRLQKENSIKNSQNKILITFWISPGFSEKQKQQGNRKRQMFIMRDKLGDYGGREVPWPPVYQLKTQKSRWNGVYPSMLEYLKKTKSATYS